MDIVNEYVPNHWQQKFHSDDWKFSALVGGKGCIRESTRIWTTEGLKAIGDIRGPQVYPSMGRDGYQLSLGTAPFPKGKANLYRVVHEHGEFVASGHHLVFCGGSKNRYIRVDHLEVGFCFVGADALFAANPLLTTGAPSLQEYARDVLRLKKIGVDFEYRCGEYIRRYGQRLLEALGISQSFLPFLSCVPGSGPVFSQEGILREGARMGLEPLRNLQAQSLFHHSKQYLSHHNPGPYEDVANYIYTTAFGCISRASQLGEKSPSTFFCRHTELERTQFAQGCIFDLDASRGRGNSLSTIKSIEKLPVSEWYWDVQVRDTNNYISEDGVIHHNSGKTFAAVQELLACALEFPGTTYVIGRKTLPSLRDSSWKAFLDIVDPRLIKESTKNPMRVEIVNGSEFLGRPLDEMKKFDSMEISGWFVDEADEIEEDMWKTLKDRTRQMIRVDGRKIVPRYRGIIGLNPTDEDHWIPQIFLSSNIPQDHKIYFSTPMDNMANLPPGYIDQLKGQYSEDQLQRLLYGQFGKVHKGRPVFPQFNRGNYVWSIEAIPDATLFRSWDFGYNNPACVWFQFIDGQMRVLDEMMGKREYIDDFAKRVLEHTNKMFPANKLVKDFCDPHGADEKDTGTTSVRSLNELGIYPQYRRQTIAEGIKAIKWLLDTKNRDGEPNFYINGRCKRLVEGFRGGYYREANEEHPAKDGYYDHLCDALRYGATFMVGRFRINEAYAKIESSRARIIHPVTGRIIEI